MTILMKTYCGKCKTPIQDDVNVIGEEYAYIKCDKCGATTKVNIKGWLFFSALFEGERV